MAGEWGGLLDWFGNLFGRGADAARGFSAADIAAGAAEGAPAATAAAAPAWSFADVAKSAWEPVQTGLSALGGVAKAVLPAVQVGTGVMGGIQSYRAGEQLAEQGKRAKESQQLQQEMTRQAAGAAQPVTQFGAEQLALAQQGQLPAPIEEQINLWKTGAIQKARDYLARIGQGDSKALLDWESWIGQQAVAMRAQALQDMQRLGVTALTGAASQAGAGAESAERQAANLEQLISQANQEILRLAGGAQ